jgi:hypothetical protein
MKMDNKKLNYYFERTLKHIHQVQINALYLIANCRSSLNMTDNEWLELAYNVAHHDRSKFSTEQFEPYVEFSWAMKNKEKLTQVQQEKFSEAWKHHYETENHHPERLKGHALKMSKVELVEVVCDLQAMADEFGEGSCMGYFITKWIPRQSENFYDDYDWEQTKIFMGDVICCLQNKGKGRVMKIEFVEELTDEKECEYLWGAGVNLDDWDYMLIMEYDPEKFAADNKPKSCTMERLLTGCCENKWYRLNFRGSERIIGIAYHA